MANPIDFHETNGKGMKELAIKIEGKFIISVRGFLEEKGYAVLLEAFSELRNTFKIYKLIIIIIIIIGLGNQKQTLKKFEKTLGLEEDVFLSGEVEMYNYFRQAQMCLEWSRIEAYIMYYYT